MPLCTRIRSLTRPCKGLITLIPRIPLIQIDVIQLAYPPQLILERHLLVMLFLPLDIRHHRIHVTAAHAKRTITILPCEMTERIAHLFVDPSRCARFHRSHHFRQIHLFAQEKQNMHMICGAAHLYGRAPVVVEYLRHIRVNILQIRLGYRVRPAFGGKHQVNIYLR